MSIEDLRALMPDYAKDIRLNLGSMLTSDAAVTADMDAKQLWIVAVASALATRQATVISHVLAEAQTQLSEDELNGAKAAAAIMGMNNIYYRFLHLASNSDYKTMPAGLRMNVMKDTGGIAEDAFELASLAVSAINGCGMCIDSHEQKLLKAGTSTKAIQAAVKIASILAATAQILDGEAVGSKTNARKEVA